MIEAQTDHYRLIRSELAGIRSFRTTNCVILKEKDNVKYQHGIDDAYCQWRFLLSQFHCIDRLMKIVALLAKLLESTNMISWLNHQRCVSFAVIVDLIVIWHPTCGEQWFCCGTRHWPKRFWNQDFLLFAIVSILLKMKSTRMTSVVQIGRRRCSIDEHMADALASFIFRSEVKEEDNRSTSEQKWSISCICFAVFCLWERRRRRRRRRRRIDPRNLRDTQGNDQRLLAAGEISCGAAHMNVRTGTMSINTKEVRDTIRNTLVSYFFSGNRRRRKSREDHLCRHTHTYPKGSVNDEM